MVAITRQKEKKKEEKRARIEWHNLQQQQQSPIDDRSLSEDSALGAAAAAALKDIIKTISLSLWLSVLTGKWQRTHCRRNNRGLRVT